MIELTRVDQIVAIVASQSPLKLTESLKKHGRKESRRDKSLGRVNVPVASFKR